LPFFKKQQKIEIINHPVLNITVLAYNKKTLSSNSHFDQEVKMPTNNTQGRAAKRNTQGGKAFKSQKKGDEGFRARAAREAAEELLDLVVLRETKGLEELKKHNPADYNALLSLQVGRIEKKFGNGRFSVLCQDNKSRNCALRGLLKRKGQCFVEEGSFVAISLTEALEDLDESDDEGHFGGGKAAAGAAFRSGADQGFIVGIFGDRAIAKLQKTGINPRLFRFADATGAEMDDLFDRSGAADEALPAAGGGGGAMRRAKKGSASASADAEAEINIDDI